MVYKCSIYRDRCDKFELKRRKEYQAKSEQKSRYYGNIAETSMKSILDSYKESKQQ